MVVFEYSDSFVVSGSLKHEVYNEWAAVYSKSDINNIMDFLVRKENDLEYKRVGFSEKSEVCKMHIENGKQLLKISINNDQVMKFFRKTGYESRYKINLAAIL